MQCGPELLATAARTMLHVSTPTGPQLLLVERHRHKQFSRVHFQTSCSVALSRGISAGCRRAGPEEARGATAKAVGPREETKTAVTAAYVGLWLAYKAGSKLHGFALWVPCLRFK